MYDIGDEDLARNYDPKKIASRTRVPKFPATDGSFECLLKRVKKDRSPNAGNLYEFKFTVTKSTSELVISGGTYTFAFFPGASDVQNEIFWRNVTPLLMAVKGEKDILSFNAADALGELMGICKDDESLELDLGFRVQCKLEPCAADKKTGAIKHKNEDGSPKIFRRDEFYAAA